MNNCSLFKYSILNYLCHEILALSAFKTASHFLPIWAQTPQCGPLFDFLETFSPASSRLRGYINYLQNVWVGTLSDAFFYLQIFVFILPGFGLLALPSWHSSLLDQNLLLVMCDLLLCSCSSFTKESPFSRSAGHESRVKFCKRSWWSHYHDWGESRVGVATMTRIP